MFGQVINRIGKIVDFGHKHWVRVLGSLLSSHCSQLNLGSVLCPRTLGLNINCSIWSHHSK